MNKFTFNTGVKIWDNPHILGGVDSGNGTIVIPFEANAPKDSKLAFLSDSPDLDKGNELLKCEVKNSKLKSKFAYFNV
jgi:hypothetical protein